MTSKRPGGEPLRPVRTRVRVTELDGTRRRGTTCGRSSELATNEVAPQHRKGAPQLVSMEVYKGRGATLVDIAKSAPFGWWPVVVLALVSFMDRLEQSVLAGAVPSIKEHFDVGNGAIGLVAAATSLAGIVLFIPAGRIADRTNRTRALAAVLVAWSLLSIG